MSQQPVPGGMKLIGELAVHLSHKRLCFRQNNAVSLAMGPVAEGSCYSTECFEMAWW